MNDSNLGPCCACQKTGLDVRNVIMVGQKGPTPGKGWGCLVCDLPLDGAVAVLCDACLDADADVQFVCVGYPANGDRMPLEDLPFEPYNHRLECHLILGPPTSEA